MSEETKYMVNLLEEGGDAAVISLKKQVLGGNDALEFTNVLQQTKDLKLKLVIADLSGVDIINSSGLGMLVSGMSHLRKISTNFALVSVPPKVMHLLEVTHLNRVFKIFDDIESAKKAF